MTTKCYMMHKSKNSNGPHGFEWVSNTFSKGHEKNLLWFVLDKAFHLVWSFLSGSVQLCGKITVEQLQSFADVMKSQIPSSNRKRFNYRSEFFPSFLTCTKERAKAAWVFYLQKCPPRRAKTQLNSAASQKNKGGFIKDI